MLFEHLVNAYEKLFKTRKIPDALKFRLYNIKANNMVYSDFIHYFNLKNATEALYFILEDNNLEDIMRYSLRIVDDERQTIYYPSNRVPCGYNDDSVREHRDINKATNEEEKEYLGKK